MADTKSTGEWHSWSPLKKVAIVSFLAVGAIIWISNRLDSSSGIDSITVDEALVADHEIIGMPIALEGRVVSGSQIEWAEITSYETYSRSFRVDTTKLSVDDRNYIYRKCASLNSCDLTLVGTLKRFADTGDPYFEAKQID